MSTYGAITARFGDHVASTLERIHEVQIEALSALGALLDEATPAFQVGDSGPSAREIAEANFSLAERVLDAQRSYTFAVLDALSPLTEKVAANARATVKQAASKTTK